MNQATKVLLLFFITDLFKASVDSKSTKDDQSLREMRNLLLTKDNIVDHLVRKQKELLIENIPKPHVVSTAIDFRSNDGDPDSNDTEGRRGRSYLDGKGNVVVEGVRAADDNSDQINYRNGQFVYNVFVPEFVGVPPETRVSSHRSGRMMSENQFMTRTLNPDFDEYYLADNKGIQDSIAMESYDVDRPAARDQPVYYLTEEQEDSLHRDRSPYSYEPADMENEDNNAHPERFVIKEHTYEMCPGCPTFNIPVPTPNEGIKNNIQYQPSPSAFKEELADMNFLEKVMSSFKNFGGKTFSFLKHDPDSSNRLTEKKGEAAAGPKQNYLPMMVAGAAAVALGGLALFGTQPSVAVVNSAQNELVYQERNGRQILDAIETVADSLEK